MGKVIKQRTDAPAKDGTMRGGPRPNAGRPKGVIPRGDSLDRLRERINAGRILARMGKVSEGELVIEDPAVENVRLRAGEILLRKVMPDLARTEHTGEDGGPLQIITRAE